MICFVILLVCCLAGALRGGGGVGGGGWGGQWVGAIIFTKDGIFTSCTNKMNILWYNLYRSSID